MWLGQWEKGLSEAREAARLEPNSIVMASNRIASSIALNRLEEAKSTVEQAQARGIDGYLSPLRDLLHGVPTQ